MGVLTKYRAGLILSAVYLACCIWLISYGVLISLVGQIISWNHDDWIAAGTIIIALFTIVLGVGTVFLVWDGREYSRRELRAYINISTAHLMLGEQREGEDLRRVVLDLIFKNFGATPAHSVKINGVVTFVGESGVAGLPYLYGSVGPTGVAMIRESFRFGSEVIKKMERRTPYMHIEGIVTYKTIFGAEAESPFNLENGHPIFDDLKKASPNVIGFHLTTRLPHQRDST